jgi:hypothetical protein
MEDENGEKMEVLTDEIRLLDQVLFRPIRLRGWS